MIVGVIGSGSIGPDLAYGFISALAREEGSKVYLHDIKEDALQAGVARIHGYVQKGLARGKLHPKVAKVVQAGVIPTLDLNDLADCEYVLEAATEDLPVKKIILGNLEKVVSKDCLCGFATSGIPRAQIAADAMHPERCFVNHPFFPAWRSQPMEIVLSGNAKYGKRMIDTIKKLGKVPIVTADVACFAADDIFCNYCAEAARIVAEGTATPYQVDRIVNEAIGGGGPFNVMDLTRGNLLNVHCLELMRDAPTGGEWFEPPPIFTEVGLKPWLDRKNPGDSTFDKALGKHVLDRILAVLVSRTLFVAENEICHPRELNWMTRNALGFSKGLLDVAEEIGPAKVNRICNAYKRMFPSFPMPVSVKKKQLPAFFRNLEVERDGDIAVVSIKRPEVMNALNEQTMEELDTAFSVLERDDEVKGIVLTSFGCSLAGADIQELAVLKTAAEAEAKCLAGHKVLSKIADFSKPVVAAVSGPVLGGGSELCMACHARVVGHDLMLGQPEVNLGIIPGYGGTQRLPRLIGLERGLDLLRTGRPVGAKEACEWGWAHGKPAADPVGAAKKLLKQVFARKAKIKPVNPKPMRVPKKLPQIDIGHHSLAIDAILVAVLRDGLTKPLPEGLKVEARGFARCKLTVDYDIGMKNFIQNGPRVPADFMHE
jgi:enoyl-CoA hydratase/3-hydroxyacyl-CoA dehydrogenase